jgi:hypothetical protein
MQSIQQASTNVLYRYMQTMRNGDEDRKHLIVICSKLMDVRQQIIIALKNILYTSMHHNLCDTIFSDTKGPTI